MKTRKLFISFTETLRKMARGQITEADFDNGLFYFGCIRSHAMNPWKSGRNNEVIWAFKSDVKGGREAHSILVKAIKKAESQGCVAWRKICVEQTFIQLNSLLKQNGIKPLPKRYEWLPYNYHQVCGAFKRTRIPRGIQVVYRDQ